jgi:Uri superfamily endonuclease
MSGLERRLIRHLARRKKLRWHIDYLLGSPAAHIKAILTYPPAPGQECRRNQFVARLLGAQIIMRKFGASDCRSGCAAHLYFFPTTQAPARIIAALKRRNTGHLRI